MKSKINTTILIIITIAVFLVMVLGATFAYFATERVVDISINANVETASSMYSFTATSTDKIEMDIAFNEMSQTNVSTTKIASDNATIKVSLSSPSSDIATVCTYDIVWVWDSDEKNRYTKPDVVSLPYTHTDGIVYNYEFSTKVDSESENDLSNLTASDNKVILHSRASITSSSTEASTQTHNIKANIYNLPVEQKNLFGKSFKAHVTIDNLNCDMIDVSNAKVLANYIQEEVYKGSNPAGTSGLYYHASDTNSANYLASGAGDNVYRYTGVDADVNNYVCFLGDDCAKAKNLYRIISVDSNTNQTKVIKATSLPSDMVWDKKTDGSYTNKWEGSTLETYLNGEYLDSLKYKANKIEMTTWNVGGYTGTQHEESNAKEIYNLEMASTPKIKRKIGLMYVSEYEFAALPKYWSLVGYNESDATKDYRASKGKDWMQTTTEWTISRMSSNKNYVFFAYYSAYVGRGYSKNLWKVRPSFNLSFDVKIMNATAEDVGSKKVPMIVF